MKTVGARKNCANGNPDLQHVIDQFQQWRVDRQKGNSKMWRLRRIKPNGASELTLG